VNLPARRNRGTESAVRRGAAARAARASWLGAFAALVTVACVDVAPPRAPRGLEGLTFFVQPEVARRDGGQSLPADAALRSAFERQLREAGFYVGPTVALEHHVEATLTLRRTGDGSVVFAGVEMVCPEMDIRLQVSTEALVECGGEEECLATRLLDLVAGSSRLADLAAEHPLPLGREAREGRMAEVSAALAEERCREDYASARDIALGEQAAHARLQERRAGEVAASKAAVSSQNARAKRNGSNMLAWIQASLTVRQVPCPASPRASRPVLQATNRSGIALTCELGEAPVAGALSSASREGKTIAAGATARFTETAAECPRAGGAAAARSGPRYELRCTFASEHRAAAWVDDIRFDGFAIDAETLAVTIPAVQELSYTEPPPLSPPPAMPEEAGFMAECRSRVPGRAR
jgi:hypothetical protein